MSVALVYDERFLAHDTGKLHPERSDRLRAVMKELRQRKLLDRLGMLDIQPAGTDYIATLHSPAYIEHVERACREGEPFLDSPDTPVCPASYEVALLAAGGVMSAADAVMAGKHAAVFCAVRPPGHHAERDRAMGFCLFNNIGLAAQRLIAHHKLKRVAVVDFDVHHCNGTQHTFERRGDVLVISMHEHPRFQYPGTGYEHETGIGEGAGATLNIPLLPGADDGQARAAFERKILPKLRDFKPEFLLISAGFDAEQDDPLGNLQFTAEGFAWMTRQLKQVAAECCEGRIVSVLEGGYNLASLARCVCTHIEVLLDG